MKEKLMEYLVCPACQSKLKLHILKEGQGQIKEAIIRCGCGMEYPVIDYIARFTDNPLSSFPDFYKRHPQYVAAAKKAFRKNVAKVENRDFDFHWSKFGSLQVNLKKLKAAREFFVGALDQPLDVFFRQKLVLDVGCGDGVHEEIFRDIDCEVIGYDISRSVDYAHRKFRLQSNIHFLQIDIEGLPFKRDFFDYIFSVGVLYHAPRPRGLFERLVGHLKSSGYLHVWMLQKKIAWDPVLKAARTITTRLPDNLLYYFCFSLSFLLYLLPTYSKINLSNSSLRECAHLFSGMLRPKALYTFREDEIIRWFNQNDLQRIKTYGEPISIIGQKTKGLRELY